MISDHESVVFNQSSVSSGDLGMDASCSSCLAASPIMPSETLSLESPGDSLGPTPDTAACSPASSVVQPNEQVVSSGDGIHGPQKVLFPSEQLSLKWTNGPGVGAGLKNTGNTCFLNTVLQCLAYTPPLANYMLSGEHSKTCLKPGFCMMCIMQKHIKNVFAKSGNVIEPTEVLSELKNIAKHFRYRKQEDAHEFLQHTVDALQTSCLPESLDGLDSETQSTFIHQVFRGCLRSRVCCLNCNSVSDTFEPFLDLPLDIERASSVSSSLEQFVRPEELDDYKCSKCKDKVSTSKTVTIDNMPNVLILPLKRFDCNGNKVSKHVKFPENINVRPFTTEPAGDPQIYSLYAVLVHAGPTCNEGHYFCYVKASSGQWYKMNDDSVSVRNIQRVLKKKAYILFYIRSELKSDGATETEPLKKQEKRKRKRSQSEEHPLVIYYKQIQAETMRQMMRQKRCRFDMEDSECDFPPEKRCCRDH